MDVLDSKCIDYKRLKEEPTIKKQKIEELVSVLSMSEAERKQRVEDKLLGEIRHAAENSRFYKKLYEENQIKIDQITKVEDIRKLPFTVKEDLRNMYPFGMRASETSEIARYGESTGTTGNPTSAYFSREDWFENNIFVSYRVSELFSEDDIVVIAAPYELSVPAQDYERIFELIGATVISCGVLNEVCSWEKILEIVDKYKPTVLICSGTRTLLMGELAKELGYDPEKNFSIKKILNVGDTINEAKGNKIKELWGAEVYNAYGMTEACALAVSCSKGNIHTFPDRYFYEVLNPETMEPVAEGEKGELVISSLGNKSMPLIRYRTGDLVTIQKKPCKCGCDTPVIVHYGRCDNIIRIGEKEISYFELEENIMACEAQNILYNVQYDENVIHITIDLNKGYSIEDFKKQLSERFHKDLIQHMDIKAFGEQERREYFEYLKNSIKPFSKIFKHV